MRRDSHDPPFISVAEAKARFSEYVRRAEGGETVVITRHGRPVVAVVPAAELERLEQLRASGPEGGLASVAGGWSGSEELVEQLARIRRSPARKSRR